MLRREIYLLLQRQIMLQKGYYATLHTGRLCYVALVDCFVKL